MASSSALLASSRAATLAPARRAGAAPSTSSPSSLTTRAVPNKKALSYDDTWKKGFWGTGLFLDGRLNTAKGNKGLARHQGQQMHGAIGLGGTARGKMQRRAGLFRLIHDDQIDPHITPPEPDMAPIFAQGPIMNVFSTIVFSASTLPLAANLARTAGDSPEVPRI